MEPGCPMSDSGGRFPRMENSGEEMKVWVVGLVSGLGGFGCDSQTSHRHNNLEVCCHYQTQDEVTLDEVLTHQSDRNHYGTQAVRTRNNQEVCCHLQSQDGVTLDGVPTH